MRLGSGQKPKCHPDRVYGAMGLCRACYANKHYQANKEATDLRSRELRYARLGWTIAEYDAALVAQGHKCYLCQRPHGSTWQRALVPDHDHGTGLRRKLLCRFCNSALGLLQDNADILARGAEYVAAHKPLPVFEAMRTAGLLERPSW